MTGIYRYAEGAAMAAPGGLPVRVKVLYFAHARSVRGTPEEILDLPAGMHVRDLHVMLQGLLGDAFPDFQLARNAAYAVADDELRDGDEIAVIPPVSGGAPLIGRDSVDLPRLIAAVSGPDMGAISVFLGTVRNEFEGRPTAALHYDAYGEMAERELRDIAESAEKRHGCRIALYHRIGTLQLEEASVGIAAAAPHRAEAFAACREVIEEIKRRAPIWKREIPPAGEPVWHGETPPAARLPEPQA